jgi:hypothetical protein
VWCFELKIMFIFSKDNLLSTIRVSVRLHGAVETQCMCRFEVNNMFMLTSNNV